MRFTGPDGKSFHVGTDRCHWTNARRVGAWFMEEDERRDGDTGRHPTVSRQTGYTTVINFGLDRLAPIPDTVYMMNEKRTAPRWTRFHSCRGRPIHRCREIRPLHVPRECIRVQGTDVLLRVRAHRTEQRDGLQHHREAGPANGERLSDSQSACCVGCAVRRRVRVDVQASADDGRFWTRYHSSRREVRTLRSDADCSGIDSERIWTGVREEVASCCVDSTTTEGD